MCETVASSLAQQMTGGVWERTAFGAPNSLLSLNRPRSTDEEGEEKRERVRLMHSQSVRLTSHCLCLHLSSECAPFRGEKTSKRRHLVVRRKELHLLSSFF